MYLLYFLSYKVKQTRKEKIVFEDKYNINSIKKSSDDERLTMSFGVALKCLNVFF